MQEERRRNTRGDEKKKGLKKKRRDPWAGRSTLGLNPDKGTRRITENNK